MKEFKAGKYYIFNKNGKKIGKAKIHALVQIDGILHAVFTYYLVALKHVSTLAVEIEGEAQTIHFGEAGWYLNADAPVQPKPVKFKVGKEYFYHNKEGFDKKIFIHAKYKDPADSLIKVVFTNGEISVCYLDKNGNEYITFCEYEINAKNVVKYEVNAKNEVKYEVNAKNEVKE